MVAATYTSDLTDIFLFESTTGVNAYGGGAGGLGASPDYSIQGTNAVDKQIDNAEKGFLYTAGAAFTIGADDHFFIWCTVAVFGLANTRDNRGIVVGIGDDTSNFVKFHVNGSDTLPKGGMLPYAVRFDNTTLANRRTLVGSPGTSPDSIGVGAFTTGTAKFSNLGGDAARIGTGYDILNGTGADPEADFSGIASDDEGTAEGIFQTTNGGFLLQGKLRIGSAGTACEFLDSNTNIFAVANLDGHALPDFTEILIENASSILTLTNVNFEALGTHNRGRLEMLTATATLTLSNVGFIGWGETVLGSGATFTGCRWVGSDQITCDGASLPNGTVSGFEDLRIIDAQDETSYDNSPTTEGTFAGGTGYAALDTITLSDGSVITVDAVSAGVVTQFTVSTTNTFGRAVNGTALTQVATSGSGTGFTLTPEADNLGDRSSLVWNNAADPNGELDGMSFTKGTAAAHAIELGTTSPLSMTFTDVASSGYNAANGNNDSFFHVKRTSGTVTINIAGGSGNFSYKTDGATVNVVTSVPLTITVKDSGGTAIANARVIVVDRSTDPPTEHMNELTTAAGVATEAYGGSTPLAIEIEVRRGDGTGGINYFPVKVPETITSSGLTNTVTLLVDPINSTLVTAGEAVLATAAAWWAVDEPGNTITTGNVETLLDKTGNGNNPTQGTAANRPAKVTGGGVSYMELDSTDDVLIEASPTAALMGNFNSGGTEVFVLKPDSGGEGTFGRLYEKGIGTFSGFWVANEAGGAVDFQHQFDMDGANHGDVVTSATWSFANPSVVDVRYDKSTADVANVTMGINNNNLTSASGLTINLNTGTTADTPPGSFYLGNRSTNDRTFDGRFYEIAFWNRELSDTEMSDVRNFLATKYSITLS